MPILPGYRYRDCSSIVATFEKQQLGQILRLQSLLPENVGVVDEEARGGPAWQQ
jgi:hypothetical protein